MYPLALHLDLTHIANLINTCLYYNDKLCRCRFWQPDREYGLCPGFMGPGLIF
jgi:hypothetical protein